MKRLIVILLMVGYLALVPFCFFGGGVVANAQAMDMGLMSSMPMQGMNDCGIPVFGCAVASGAMGSFIHHVEMYLSLTSTTPTILGSLATIALLLFVAVFLVLKIWRQYLSSQAKNLLHRSIREDGQVKAQPAFLRWLSLFESSPNFA